MGSRVQIVNVLAVLVLGLGIDRHLSAAAPTGSPFPCLKHTARRTHTTTSARTQASVRPRRRMGHTAEGSSRSCEAKVCQQTRQRQCVHDKRDTTGETNTARGPTTQFTHAEGAGLLHRRVQDRELALDLHQVRQRCGQTERNDASREAGSAQERPRPKASERHHSLRAQPRLKSTRKLQRRHDRAANETTNQHRPFRCTQAVPMRTLSGGS